MYVNILKINKITDIDIKKKTYWNKKILNFFTKK